MKKEQTPSSYRISPKDIKVIDPVINKGETRSSFIKQAIHFLAEHRKKVSKK